MNGGAGSASPGVYLGDLATEGGTVSYRTYREREEYIALAYFLESLRA
jgi:hypothetical protein